MINILRLTNSKERCKIDYIHEIEILDKSERIRNSAGKISFDLVRKDLDSSMTPFPGTEELIVLGPHT